MGSVTLSLLNAELTYKACGILLNVFLDHNIEEFPGTCASTITTKIPLVS
jgi:hypothetical protein